MNQKTLTWGLHPQASPYRYILSMPLMTLDVDLADFLQ